VNVRLKISPVVATIIRSFSEIETSHCARGRGWDFHAGLPKVWNSNTGVEKRNSFVYIYRVYLINAMVLYVDLCTE